MKKTLIFDFDGTIADTFSAVVEIANKLADKHHYKKVYAALSQKEGRPVRVVVSGQANQNDPEGNLMLERLQHIVSEELKGTVVYLPDYQLSLARMMTTGCDIWLNTPVVGFEACGTSGMKAALNGTLPLTTRDGWIDEVDLTGIGWVIDNNQVTQSLLDILEKEAVPLFYTRDQNGVPTEWVNHMKKGRELIVNRFTTTRMLKEYFEKFYLQIINVHYNREERQMQNSTPLKDL